MKERRQPIYDFCIRFVSSHPRTASEITMQASAHFGRFIDRGSIGRALKRAQANGIARRLDDLTWVQPEEYDAAQRAKLKPEERQRSRLGTTKRSNLSKIPYFSGERVVRHG